MLEIENRNSFEQTICDSVNLFLGAGFSVLAKNAADQSLPVGSKLRDELVSTFSLERYESLDLPRLCTILARTRAHELDSFLRARLTVCTFDPRYSALLELPIARIFTTNIDNLLELVFENHPSRYLNDVQLQGPAFKTTSAIPYYKLNGSVSYIDRPLAFSAMDLATRFRSDPALWYALTNALNMAPTLFWGYSLSDAATLEAISPQAAAYREHKAKWLILHPSEPASGLDYFRVLGFQIILGETPEFLDYLATLTPKPRPAVVSPRTTRTLFPGECIPDPATCPARPILEFYSGCAPIWSDVFSGTIAKTHHYLSIKNSIDGRKNIVCIGIPASGKTTVLMQLAQGVVFSGHKLVLDSLTSERAALILRQLQGDNALIFVDNFCDSLNGINALSPEPTVQLVLFDREHNLDIAAHRIDLVEFTIHNVTELSEPDISTIIERIPSALRSRDIRDILSGAGENVSIFEVVQHYVTGRPLVERIERVCRELSAMHSLWLELLLVCAYVHSCRTPVSMDMLIGYFRDDISSYKDIYRMIEGVGRMLGEYRGELADELQDYYAPRSTIFAEVVMKACDGEGVRRMLEKFHNNLSPFRIHRYDVFKRQAYDADVVGKAYPDWQEGKEFYLRMWDRDRSPYIKQQGALYLHRQRKNRDAFVWIDQAVNESGGRVWSIRNSHAIIMFNANINQPEMGTTVVDTLRQSMRILEQCYTEDRRKPFHAEVYARQAVQYWRRFRDEIGGEYLKRAREWLGKGREAAPWRKETRKLLREVEVCFAEASA